MTPVTTDPVVALAADYFEAFPNEAAAESERLPGPSLLDLFGVLPHAAAARAMEHLRADVAAGLLAQIEPTRGSLLLAGLDPGKAAALLARLKPETREQLLNGVEPALASELQELMSYPPDSAGAIMDSEVTTFRPSMTVAQALARLRALRTKRVQYVFVVDDEHCLAGAVPLQELAVAEPNQPLQALMAPAVSVQSMSSQSEVVEILERHRVT
jgi:magnesium transporter